MHKTLQWAGVSGPLVRIILERWLDEPAELAELELPPGAEVVVQLVEDSEGSVWIQGSGAAANTCTHKIALANKYRFDHGNLRSSIEGDRTV